MTATHASYGEPSVNHQKTRQDLAQSPQKHDEHAHKLVDVNGINFICHEFWDNNCIALEANQIWLPRGTLVLFTSRHLGITVSPKNHKAVKRPPRAPCMQSIPHQFW